MDSQFILKLVRLLGLYPCNQLGLSTKWMIYSVTFNTVFCAIHFEVRLSWLTAYRSTRLTKYSIAFVSLHGLIPLIYLLSFATCGQSNSVAKTLKYAKVRPFFLILFMARLIPKSSTIFFTRGISAGLITELVMTANCHLVVMLFFVVVSDISDQIRKCRLRIPEQPFMAYREMREHLSMSEHVSTCFSLTLLLVIITETYSLSTYVFFVYKGNPLTSIASISGIHYSINLFLVLHLSSSLKTEVDAFYDELFRVVKRRNDLCGNKKMALYLKIRPKINFTACGLFSLGYPLFTSIIATATTYLIILVQFDPI